MTTHLTHGPRRTAAADDKRFAALRRSAYQRVTEQAWTEAESEMTHLCEDSRFGAGDWVALATARYRLARVEPARQAAARALAVEPDNVKAAHLLTLALIAQNRWAEALPVFERHAAGPARSHYHFVMNHGTTLVQLRRPQEAVNVLLEAAVLNMSDPAIHMKIALALRDMKMYEEAAESFQTAVTLDRTRVAAQMMMVHMRQHACQWRGFEADRATVAEAVERLDSDEIVRADGAVFALTGMAQSAMLYRTATRHVTAAQARLAQPLPRRAVARAGERRIRVGYVSNDFFNHATAVLFVEALEQRNRQDFEVTLYSHGKTDDTAIGQRIRAACERFVDMGALSERQMAERIHADGIDLLVDLKGHTNGNRLGLFAHRPAPVQASFLGFPATTGADFIDYFIGDRIVTPLEHAHFYAEKIAQLPHSYQPNDSRRPRPAPLTRAQCGLPENARVLGCFNQAFKLTPETFDAWMRILQAVPDSVLWMLEDNAQAGRNLQREMQQRGVDPARLVFAPRVTQAEHLARLPAADLMLDNWPCNAHTTAADALWMGVPIVTVMGEPFVSRVAASLLHAVELGELVCTDAQAYEATVVGLLRQPQKLQALRRHLEEGRTRFALFDGARFAQDLENVYRRMIARAREGLAPDALPA